MSYSSSIPFVPPPTPSFSSIHVIAVRQSSSSKLNQSSPSEASIIVAASCVLYSYIAIIRMESSIMEFPHIHSLLLLNSLNIHKVPNAVDNRLHVHISFRCYWNSLFITLFSPHFMQTWIQMQLLVIWI